MAARVTTLNDLITTAVVTYGENPLFGTRAGDGDWDWMTYAAFGESIEKARGGLASLGVGAGDRVAIISDNRIEWAVGAYATYTLGAGQLGGPGVYRLVLQDGSGRTVTYGDIEVIP